MSIDFKKLKFKRQLELGVLKVQNLFAEDCDVAPESFTYHGLIEISWINYLAL